MERVTQLVELEDEPGDSDGLTPDERLIRLHADPDAAFFPGHFAGNPVVPGFVQIQAAASHALRVWPGLGRLKSAPRVKFEAPIPPGASLRLRLTRSAGEAVSFEFASDEQVYGHGRLGFEVDRGSKKAGTFIPCGLLPTYNNPVTVERVVRAVKEHVGEVIVVDDGSGDPGREACDRVAQDLGVRLVRHERNQGKGAAVKTGLHAADELGFTHVVQVDADGQHNLEDIPRFLERARAQPEAVILGVPRFGGTQPRIRSFGHWLTSFWTRLEVGGDYIEDPQCGFRVYPVQATIAAGVRGNRMDFDPEVAVRMCWAGAQIINLPTEVRYLAEAEGGVSHFKMGLDNLLISWMHTRLATLAIFRFVTRPLRRKR